MAKPHRYKLLLDEGLSPCKDFQRVNERHDLKHVRDDYKKGGSEDPQVYELAKKTNRLLVIFNIKDYRDMALLSKDTGIIGVSRTLSEDQIDKKLLALLTKSKPGQLFGKYNTITGETRV